MSYFPLIYNKITKLSLICYKRISIYNSDNFPNNWNQGVPGGSVTNAWDTWSQGHEVEPQAGGQDHFKN